jgi:hypothetical protein
VRTDHAYLSVDYDELAVQQFTTLAFLEVTAVSIKCFGDFVIVDDRPNVDTSPRSADDSIIELLAGSPGIFRIPPPIEYDKFERLFGTVDDRDERGRELASNDDFMHGILLDFIFDRIADSRFLASVFRLCYH